MGALLIAGRSAFTELKNLVVWNKSNGGMGAFYRSKHELIFVFKQGTAEHTNSFGLGETGRYRTNVWDYAGISSMSASRGDELAMHPTVKPVALIADAIRDCSRRGEIILDARMKDLILDDWLHEQRIFDIINDRLPPRYQTKLENRSYADGASQAGDYPREDRRRRA